ncbi:armadillo-type protein [Gloeopeniophorella convolvens]|nr:armadillo-type protein [Gloeopeniophorella convolvens]
MQSLLRWGIENSGKGDETAAPVAPRTDLDPEIIDLILGKPDAELMKESLARAQDESVDEDARLTALDDLEMLVENIDNANDLEKLKMWEPLQKLLTSPSNDIKVQALWVIGTALQNNPAAQKAYLSLSPFSTVLSFLSPSVRSSALRSKAVYAISGLLKHSTAAIAQFEEAGGWDTLRGSLSDSDIGVRRKTAFLLNTLLIPVPTSSDSPSTAATIRDSAAAPVHANSHASMLADPGSADTAPAAFRALRAHALLPTVVRELAEPTPYGPDGESEGDADLEEKLARLLHTYVSAHHGTFEDAEKSSLRKFLEARRGAQEALGLDADELRDLKAALA